GISEESIQAFFEQVRAVAAWQNNATAENLRPFGENTSDAIAVILALKEKIEDYFTRVEMANFDPRATHIMNGEESELVRLANLSLADTDALKSLPLAGIHNGEELPLTKGLNPAYSASIAQLLEKVIRPILGAEVKTITREQWQAILA